MEPTSLSIVQLAAIVAGYALAFSRLTDAARPLWQWVKPPWLQTLLPALVTVLPDFASALGLVKTKTDFVQAIVVAVGALGFAMRGALPKKVYDRLPPAAKQDLKAARQGKEDDDKTPPRSGHPPVIGLCFVALVLLVACPSSPPLGPPCDQATLAGIVAECSLRVETECASKDVPEHECQALMECDKRLDARAEMCR